MKIRFFVVFLFVIGSLTNPALSQGYDTDIPLQQLQYSDRPAQYILGRGDVLLITVNLWGHVLKPGIYSVPSSFGIIDLLSSAGGPLKTARLNDVRIIRKNQEVITVNIEQFTKTGNQDLLVSLQPGDVVIVSGSISDIFVRIIGVMADIAIILNVIILANRL
jgi:protein involved in polysaccharide export with SLBB domain